MVAGTAAVISLQLAAGEAYLLEDPSQQAEVIGSKQARLVGASLGSAGET